MSITTRNIPNSQLPLSSETSHLLLQPLQPQLRRWRPHTLPAVTSTLYPLTIFLRQDAFPLARVKYTLTDYDVLSFM